ncbi:MarR family protein [Pigmentiphaga humi]|uniref:MarR family protein n=1 Tax=Pigmentiphaga humi TaxID=2478468 RepID=A0A3P4B5W8_9BURK|nr:MarR family transcriptional regulator [Pigmentiphaga humi]VCU71667.1 MarR family protein [Pigmentiphaga humi]
MASSSTPPSPGRRERYGSDRSLGYLLNRTADIVSTAFIEILRNESISLPEWRVLTVLTDRDQQTLSELASHVGTELSYLSRIVVHAEQRGLVARLASPADKRSTCVSITEAGRAMVRLFMPQARALEATWLRDIPPDDVKVLRRTLQALYINVLDASTAAPSSGRKLKVAHRARNRREAPAAKK